MGTLLLLMMKLIIVKAHKSNYPDPIDFKKGDCLMIANKDNEFKGWIRVTTKDGNQGWAPVQYLQIQNGKRAIATRDYTAAELDTTEGEVLFLHYELNGWGWVERKEGSCGWVPMNTAKIA